MSERRRCTRCNREEPTYIFDPHCSRGIYCEFREPKEYRVALDDASGSELAGVSLQASSDEAVNDEARELALEHEWAVRARVLCKSDRRSWVLTLSDGVAL